eukprot:gene38983-52658_t
MLHFESASNLSEIAEHFGNNNDESTLFFINRPVIEAMCRMMTADILITSGSSLAFVATISKGQLPLVMEEMRKESQPQFQDTFFGGSAIRESLRHVFNEDEAVLLINGRPIVPEWKFTHRLIATLSELFWDPVVGGYNYAFCFNEHLSVLSLPHSILVLPLRPFLVLLQQSSRNTFESHLIKEVVVDGFALGSLVGEVELYEVDGLALGSLVGEVGGFEVDGFELGILVLDGYEVDGFALGRLLGAVDGEMLGRLVGEVDGFKVDGFALGILDFGWYEVDGFALG